MERVMGVRADSYLYYDRSNFYLYRKRSSATPSRNFYHCVEPYCVGRALWYEGVGVPTVLTGHSHFPDRSAVELLQVEERLRERAASESTPLCDIFIEEIQAADEDTAYRAGPFGFEFEGHMKNIMESARRRAKKAEKQAVYMALLNGLKFNN